MLKGIVVNSTGANEMFTVKEWQTRNGRVDIDLENDLTISINLKDPERPTYETWSREEDPMTGENELFECICSGNLL